MTRQNRPLIAFACITNRSPLETKTMTQHITITEKGNKSVWTLDSEAAKRIFQPAASALHLCRGAAIPSKGKERLGGNNVHS